MKLLRNTACLVYLALVAACGDDGPPAPTAPSLTSITVTGSDLLLVGNSETFAAAGNTGGLTAPRWGSDAPTVATVDGGSGRVTAVGTGTVTIFVDANGIRGTKLIRTLPNFGGEWSGRYALINCESRANRSFCPERSTNDTYALSMSFTQNRDSVSGSFTFDGAEADEYGTVSPDGILSLSGVYTLFGYLDNVRFESTQPGQMTGTFEEFWPGFDGRWTRFVFQLRDVRKK